MFEILLLAATVYILMVKVLSLAPMLLLGVGSKGFGKQGKGFILYSRIEWSATIASGNHCAVQAIVTLSKPFRVLKTEYFLELTAKNAAEGPVVIGLHDSNLSATEVEEHYQASPDPDDPVECEEMVRPVFAMTGFGNKGGTECLSSRSGDAFQELKMRWSFNDSISMHMYDIDGNGITATTTIQGLIKFYGVWVQ